jgi:membrane protease YdiL (CAAX protease family)
MSRSRRRAALAAAATPRTWRDRIAATFPAAPADAPPLDRRTVFVFVAATILLVVFQYFGRPDYYRVSDLQVALRPSFEAWLGPHAPMAAYLYWGVTSLVLRVAIPLAIVAFVFREPLASYGWRWRGQFPHVPTYAALYLAMLPLIIWAASLPSFQAKYPFYKGAAEGGAVFWLYELSYGAQFMGVETFFRGFLLFALFRRFGYYALFIMAIPYVMVHFNKPLPEVFGALGAAVILGALALRAGSCVLGILLHWAVGLTMDVLAIAKALGGLGPAVRAILS